jgi:hypothetical protein
VTSSSPTANVAAFERVVLPALRRFRPEAIFVASGFDGCAMDSLGRMLVTSATLRALARWLRDAAAELCGGRLIPSHEAGYSTAHGGRRIAPERSRGPRAIASAGRPPLLRPPDRPLDRPRREHP